MSEEEKQKRHSEAQLLSMHIGFASIQVELMDSERVEGAFFYMNSYKQACKNLVRMGEKAQDIHYNTFDKEGASDEYHNMARIPEMIKEIVETKELGSFGALLQAFINNDVGVMEEGKNKKMMKYIKKLE